MNLFPRDLGTERCLALVRRRLMPLSPVTMSGQPVSSPPTKPLIAKASRSRLMRFWTRDLGLSGEAEEKAKEIVAGWPSFSAVPGLTFFLSLMFLLPALGMLTAGGGVAFLGLVLLSFWALMMYCTVFVPRSTLKQAFQKPLTAQEVESLLPSARGRLDRAYLSLVLDAVRHEATMSPSAQGDVRASLSALGDTIAKLPAGPVPTTDPALLRHEAEDFRLQAGRETDAFVRASFLRQAESLEKRADLGSENAVSGRRVSALRREARTQMDALRALLAAFGQVAPGEAAQNVALAEAVNRVAGEAQAIGQAHRELADAEIAALLGHPMPAGIPVQPVQQVPTLTTTVATPSYGGQQAVGGNPNAAPPQVQQVGSGNSGGGNNGGGRPWWRG